MSALPWIQACLASVLLGAAAHAGPLPPPQDVRAFDTPNDGGGSVTVVWAPSPYDGPAVLYEVTIEALEDRVEESWEDASEDPLEGTPASPAATSAVVVATLPSHSHYVRDAPHPWWIRPAPPDFHHLKVTSRADLTLANGRPYAVQITAVQGAERAATRVAPVVPMPNWVNWAQVNNLLLLMLFGAALFGCIRGARRAHARQQELFLRRIPGLDAVDEAIGRATELGKPILYLTGAQDMRQPSTIAAAVILGRVAKRVAAYETQLIVPHRDPIVMAVCQEITKQSYLEAGKPEAYKEDANFFITDDQFSYTAAVDGIMLRQKPAANFFMGYYYAESLLLTETGASTGAIQIAGTDADHQLPFFVTTCDYTLIGEELYAASAYLSREPMQVGTLRAQDLGKAVLLTVLVLGSTLATVGAWVDASWPQYVLDVFRDMK